MFIYIYKYMFIYMKTFPQLPVKVSTNPLPLIAYNPQESTERETVY